MTEVVRDFTLSNINKDTVQVIWSGLDADDSGKAVDLSGYPDKTIHIFGTPNGATTTLYCSNDPAVLTDRAAGTLFGSATANWKSATDAAGSSIAKTSSAISQIMEESRFVAPVNTGGGVSTSITVVIVATRSRV